MGSPTRMALSPPNEPRSRSSLPSGVRHATACLPRMLLSPSKSCPTIYISSTRMYSTPSKRCCRFNKAADLSALPSVPAPLLFLTGILSPL